MNKMVRDHFDLMTIIETKVNQETFNRKKERKQIFKINILPSRVSLEKQEKENE